MTHNIEQFDKKQPLQLYNQHSSWRWFNLFDSFAVVGPCLQRPTQFIEEIAQAVDLGYGRPAEIVIKV